MSVPWMATWQFVLNTFVAIQKWTKDNHTIHAASSSTIVPGLTTYPDTGRLNGVAAVTFGQSNNTTKLYKTGNWVH